MDGCALIDVWCSHGGKQKRDWEFGKRRCIGLEWGRLGCFFFDDHDMVHDNVIVIAMGYRDWVITCS